MTRRALADWLRIMVLLGLFWTLMMWLFNDTPPLETAQTLARTWGAMAAGVGTVFGWQKLRAWWLSRQTEGEER